MSTPYSSYSILNSNNNNNNSTATSSTAYPATPSQTPAATTSTQYTAVFDSNSLQNLPGTPTPSGRGRPRGGGGGGVLLNGHGQGQTGSGTGAKRGRKPRGGAPESSTSFMTSTFSASGSPQHSSTPLTFGTTNGTAASTSSAAAAASSANAQYPRVHWAMPGSSTTTTTATTSAGPLGAGESANSLDSANTNNNHGEGSSSTAAGRAGTPSGSEHRPETPLSYSPPSVVIDPALTGAAGTVTSSSGAIASTTLAYTPTVNGGSGSRRGTPLPEGTGSLVLPGSRGASVQPYGATGAPGIGAAGARGGDDEVEADDELLPAMADDDYSAQLSWQSQSKDNLKVLMDNLSPAQYDRFEAYRRHALPKQAVRKVIQQTLGQQVSQPVAQIIAGFSKVFVGEIVEKARAVQTRRGETGPLSPDHLREAYRAYQEETGRVGSARPLRAKKLFVR